MIGRSCAMVGDGLAHVEALGQLSHGVQLMLGVVQPQTSQVMLGAPEVALVQPAGAPAPGRELVAGQPVGRVAFARDAVAR